MNYKQKAEIEGCINCRSKELKKKMHALVCTKCEAIYTTTGMLYYPDIQDGNWQTKKINMFKNQEN